MISIDCSSSCPRWSVGCWALAWGHWAPWPYIGQLSIRHNTATRLIHYNTSCPAHAAPNISTTCRTQFGDVLTRSADYKGRRRCDDDCVYISICFTRHFLSCRVPGDWWLHITQPSPVYGGPVLRLLVVTIMICLLSAEAGWRRRAIIISPGAAILVNLCSLGDSQV